MEENLDIFLSGLDAQYVVFDTFSGPRKVRAYFDNAFFDSSVGETVLDTTQPRITCKYIDVHDIDLETNITINNKQFSVTQIQPDGNGFATIALAYE